MLCSSEMYGPTSGGLTWGEIETLAIMASYPDLVYLDRVDLSSTETMDPKWINYAELELINLFFQILELLCQQGGMENQKKQPLLRQKMADLASAISERSAEIFDLLDEVNGGLATLTT